VEPFTDGTLTKEQYDHFRNGSEPPPAEPTTPKPARRRSINAGRLGELLNGLPGEITAVELAGWRCERVIR
jgi:hypothetical protein